LRESGGISGDQRRSAIEPARTGAPEALTGGDELKAKQRGGCLPILLPVVGVLVLTAIIGYVTKGKAKPVTAADVSLKVSGTVVRNGCVGCGKASTIQTRDVYCGWDANDVVVHVEFANTSSHTLTATRYSAYVLQDGTVHGTESPFVQKTEVRPGLVRDVFSELPASGSPRDTPIANCYPSLANVIAT